MTIQMVVKELRNDPPPSSQPKKRGPKGPRQPEDERCDSRRKAGSMCDVHRYANRGLGCSKCALTARTCVFEGQTLQGNKNVPGARPVKVVQDREAKCDLSKRRSRRCNTDGTIQCTNCALRELRCFKNGNQLQLWSELQLEDPN